MDPRHAVPQQPNADPSNHNWLLDNLNDCHKLEFHRFFADSVQQSCYAYARIFVGENDDFALLFGTHKGHGCRLWLNNELLVDERKFVIEGPETIAIPARLNKGWNTVLVKVFNAGGHPWFSLKVSDEASDLVRAYLDNDRLDDAIVLIDSADDPLLSATVMQRRIDRDITKGKLDRALSDEKRLIQRLETELTKNENETVAYRLADLLLNRNMDRQVEWRILRPIDKPMAKNGTELERLADGSLRADRRGGPEQRILVDLPMRSGEEITAIRIESLPDEDLPKPQEGAGAFVLRKFRAMFGSREKEASPELLRLRNAAASTSVPLNGMAQAIEWKHFIDGRSGNYWKCRSHANGREFLVITTRRTVVENGLDLPRLELDGNLG